LLPHLTPIETGDSRRQRSPAIRLAARRTWTTDWKRHLPAPSSGSPSHSR